MYRLDAAVVSSGDTLYSNETDTSTRYQWIDCANANSSISGATSRVFTPDSSGIYGLVLSRNLCLADTSACINFSKTNLTLSREKAGAIAIYPNPNQGELSLDLGEVKKASVRLSNALGQVLWTKELQNVSVAPLTIQGASGLYFLEVKTASQRLIFKLFKE